MSNRINKGEEIKREEEGKIGKVTKIYKKKRKKTKNDNH